MKTGTENRTKTYVAVAMMAIALLVFVRTMFFSSGYPAPAAPAAAVNNAGQAPTGTPTATAPRTQRSNPGRATRSNARTQQTAPPVVAESLDPRLRLDLLKQTEETKYTGSGRNIFSDEPPPPPAPKVDTPPVTEQAQQTGPPPPPPIDLKFFGFASRNGDTKKIFLSQGGDVFVASEGEIVQRRYRILRINANSVDVEDVLTNNRQTIQLTAG